MSAKVIKEKKKKTGHSMPSNIFYFVKLLFKLSPGLVIGEFVMDLLQIMPTRLISVIGIKYIIDTVAKGENLNKVFYAIGLIAGILILSRTVTWIFREFYWNMARERLYYSLNKTLYEKAKALDLESYDNPDFYNNFILTIESSSDNIQNLMTLVKHYVNDIISLITISSILFTIDPWCLVIIFASVLIFLPISRKIGDLQMGRRTDNAKFHRRSDYFQRIFYLQDYAKEVRMNSIKPLLIDRYNDAATDVVTNQQKYWKKISFFYCIQETGIHIIGFMFLMPLYLGYCVLVKQTLSAGDFVATFNGGTQIAWSINFLTVWALANFSERAKMIEKYREFLSVEHKIKNGEQNREFKTPEPIEIKNLSFTYPGNDEPTLKNINLTIKPYEKIALVGYNGAGKSTLTNLLLRLYDVTEGEIKIGSVDIRSNSVDAHRNMFSAVFQDFQTYACTLKENVALDINPDEKRVTEALKHSGFSKKLKNGINSELLREFDDEGVMLSGGETQKAAIARVFYKDCPYAILDEPSANLDPVAEYNLNQAMMEAAKHKTVIFISHRLSTTINADRICVMENGEIIETGTHSELMAMNGTYAKMFTLQSEKYKNA